MALYAASDEIAQRHHDNCGREEAEANSGITGEGRETKARTNDRTRKEDGTNQEQTGNREENGSGKENERDGRKENAGEDDADSTAKHEKGADGSGIQEVEGEDTTIGKGQDCFIEWHSNAEYYTGFQTTCEHTTAQIIREYLDSTQDSERRETKRSSADIIDFARSYIDTQKFAELAAECAEFRTETDTWVRRATARKSETTTTEDAPNQDNGNGDTRRDTFTTEDFHIVRLIALIERGTIRQSCLACTTWIESAIDNWNTRRSKGQGRPEFMESMVSFEHRFSGYTLARGDDKSSMATICARYKKHHNGGGTNRPGWVDGVVRSRSQFAHARHCSVQRCFSGEDVGHIGEKWVVQGSAEGNIGRMVQDYSTGQVTIGYYVGSDTCIDDVAPTTSGAILHAETNVQQTSTLQATECPRDSILATGSGCSDNVPSGLWESQRKRENHESCTRNKESTTLNNDGCNQIIRGEESSERGQETEEGREANVRHEEYFWGRVDRCKEETKTSEEDNDENGKSLFGVGYARRTIGKTTAGGEGFIRQEDTGNGCGEPGERKVGRRMEGTVSEQLATQLGATECRRCEQYTGGFGNDNDANTLISTQPVVDEYYQERWEVVRIEQCQTATESGGLEHRTIGNGDGATSNEENRFISHLKGIQWREETKNILCGEDGRHCRSSTVTNNNDCHRTEGATDHAIDEGADAAGGHSSGNIENQARTRDFVYGGREPVISGRRRCARGRDHLWNCGKYECNQTKEVCLEENGTSTYSTNPRHDERHLICDQSTTSIGDAVNTKLKPALGLAATTSRQLETFFKIRMMPAPDELIGFCEVMSVGKPMRIQKALGGCPVRLNLTMVQNIGMYDADDHMLAGASWNSTQENVAAIIMLMHQCPTARKAFIDYNWFKVGITQWLLLKNWFEALHKIDRCEDFAQDEIDKLRSIFKCVVRWDIEADWDNEFINRCIDVPMHVLPQFGARCRSEYLRRENEIINKCAGMVVGQLGGRRRILTAREWWCDRSIQIAGGSSHIRNLFSDEPVLAQMMQSGDRVDKKGVVELMDDDFFEHLLYAGVERNWAFGSTKKEPGGKQRALLASHDFEYFIDAYASCDMEKHLKVGGMLGKQGVRDVAEWISKNRQARGTHICLDFTDFNTTHEHRSLFELNVAIAKAFATYHSGSEALNDKVIAALTTANSIFNSFYCIDGEFRRATSGLFSGTRNTARDNTMLHYVYLNLNKMNLVDCGIVGDVENVVMCGDDEDLRTNSRQVTEAWCNSYSIMGHELNMSKQLLSSQKHEFLKMMHVCGVGVNRPICSILATIATGNWYVPSAVWYYDAPEAVASNFADLVGRGFSWKAAQKLAIMYLDVIMKVKTDEKTMRINWWPYAAQSEVSKAFWAGSNCGTSEWPVTKVKNVHHCLDLVHNGTKAIMDKFERFTREMTGAQVEVAEQALVMASYGKTLHSKRLDMSVEDAHNLPIVLHGKDIIRTVTESVCAEASVMQTLYQRMAIVAENEVISTSKEESLARIGVLPAIGSALTTQQMLRCIHNPAIWALWAEPRAERKLKLDIGLPAMLRNEAALAEKREIPLMPSLLTTEKITLVISMNGGGKTTWANRNRLFVLDVDTVIGSRSDIRLHSDADFGTRVACADKVLEQAITKKLFCIVGQRLMPEIATTLVKRQLLKQMIVVNIPDSTITERLMARGWTITKINTRKTQYAKMITSLEKLMIKIKTVGNFNEVSN